MTMTMTMTMTMLIIYIVGMVGGFIFAAYKKGDWWIGGPGSNANGEWFETDSYVPVSMTLFWWVILLYAVVCMIAWLLYTTLTKFLDALDFVHCKLKRFSSIKHTHVISPLLKEGYRLAGATPCIACGTPTSLNQDGMCLVDKQSINSMSAARRPFLF